MSRPVNLFGAARLHVFGPDTTTSLGYLAGADASGTHSKMFSESALSFSANTVDDALLAADETVLEGAFVVAELAYDGDWLAIGTPYMLSPGSGVVAQEGGRTHTPVAASALAALLEECVIFPTECDPDHPTFKRGGGTERNRYFTFWSKGYSESLHTWHDADIYDPSAGFLVGGGGSVAESTDDTITEAGHGLTDGTRVRVTVTSGGAGLTTGVYFVVDATTDDFKVSETEGGGAVEITSDGVVNVYSGVGAKFDKPDDFPAVLAAAEWVWRDAEEGGRTCFREDTFTLDVDQRVVFAWCSDENGKWGVDGPNQGGIVIDWDADEDGYNQGFGHKTLRLKAGTYRAGGWMQSIRSEGGDGNDSARYGAYSIATDGSGDVDQVLYVSGANTRVLRQPISDQLPGMSPGEVMRRALATCSDVGSEAADLLLANRTFTDTLDTDEAEWDTFVEWVWPWGTSLASAFADLLAEIDLDMGPEFTFDAWQDRGSDLSATVKLTPGATTPTAAMNITAYTYDSDPAGPNAYLTESEEGSGLYVGTPDSGERQRYGAFESGASGTVGRANRNARKAVKANGSARRHYDAEALAVAGHVPWDNFTICDVINGRGYRNLGLDVEVTSLSWKQAESVTFSATLTIPAP